MKKLLTLVVAVLMAVTCCLGLTACGGGESGAKEEQIPAISFFDVSFSQVEIDEDFKLGVICLHDEASTYDKNFIDAAKDAAKKMGLSNEQLIFKTGIPESSQCYEEAKVLINAGCDAIFADSFGHEDFMIQAATEYPNIQFYHATGTQAHTKNLPNFHNAFASIYEGRYLAGIAAGMKLNQMISEGKFTAAEAKIGYVGAWPYAEVKSGYTAFYLGAKSVCPTATMEVKFTNSWYDATAEKETAQALIANGCKLISQHADSMGAPSACEEAGVPNVSYNGSTIEECPNTFIISSRIDWTLYFQNIIAFANTNEPGAYIPADFTGGTYDNFKAGTFAMVALTALNADVAAPGTVDAIVKARLELATGTRKVFDVDTFTVTIDPAKTNFGVVINSGATIKVGEQTIKGSEVTEKVTGKLVEYIADVDDLKGEDGKSTYIPETQVVKTDVKTGITYFAESEFRSAPYFDIDIDGIILS